METSRYKIKKQDYGVELEVNDSIHNSKDVFLRKIKVSNKLESKQEIRLFFTHDFHIYGNEAGDTAFQSRRQDPRRWKPELDDWPV